jgi:hypothetical protein
MELDTEFAGELTRPRIPANKGRRSCQSGMVGWYDGGAAGYSQTSARTGSAAYLVTGLSWSR